MWRVEGGRRAHPAVCWVGSSEGMEVDWGTHAAGVLRLCSVATMRRRVGFAAAVAHARLRLSRLQLMGHEGRTAARAVRPADAHTSPTVFEQARGAPLGAGGGRAGFAGGGML